MAHLRNFLQYYEQYKNKIYTYVLYRVSFDQALAEDLTSDIFLKAYEHFEDFDEKRPFAPWMYTITHHHLMSFLKNQKKTFSLDEAKMAQTDPSFIDEIEKKMTMGKILRAIQALPDLQQTALLLRFQHGLSYVEIAHIMERDDTAARMIVSRAIASLREKICD